MINKRLLHFLSFVYFKRRSAWEKMNHALIVVERQQMLRHFYSMITPLLTLHTATTATLLVVSLTLNNTKKNNLYNQFCNSHNKQICLNLILKQVPHRFTTQFVYCEVTDRRWIPKQWRTTIRRSSEISDNGLSTVNVLLTIKPLVFCTQRMSCPLSSLPKFGLSAPSLLGVARANWAPRCLLWICAFVLLIPIRSMFDVP